MSIGGGVRFREDGRTPTQLRPVSVELDVQKWTSASVIIRVGGTHVLCAATIEDRIPPHLRGKGTGWVTAEYSMLPGATSERSQRESSKGRIGGRTHEIQRLIGRSLRGVVNTAILGERTVTIDCDVIQADGGTRCASITGGWIALSLALRRIGLERAVVSQLAAVSVGIMDGVPILDLDYPEDSHAEVDFNVVATSAGTYVEVQGTAEGKPFSRTQLDELLALADSGIAQLFEVQRRGPRRRSRGGGPAPVTVRLLLATRSEHKLQELQTLLHLPWLELVTLDEAGVAGEAVEDAATFRGNAIIKARFYCGLSGMPTLADDSGVEVDALGGAPGVFTKRYAGPDATDEQNNQQAARGAGRPAHGAAPGPLSMRARVPRPALPAGRRPALGHDPLGHPGGTHRVRAPRLGRLWLRPHLRAAQRAGQRPDGRRLHGRGEEPGVAPRPCRARHGPLPQEALPQPMKPASILGDLRSPAGPPTPGSDIPPDASAAREPLIRFVAAVFRRAGLRTADARTCADVLVLADARGHPSHGVSRLRQYIRLLETGSLRADARPRLVAGRGAIEIMATPTMPWDP